MPETIAETERLRLRNWEPEDLDEFVRHTNTEAVMRWLGGVWPLEKHEAAFGRIKAYERDHGHTFWLVERKSDGELLGFCGLIGRRRGPPRTRAAHLRRRPAA